MKLLAIDTSTAAASVALVVDGCFSTMTLSAQRQQALEILPAVNQLLLQFSCSSNELDGIVFGRGPGSFTGLRVASSVAQGLAYAHDLPIYPVSSLLALAYPILCTYPDALVLSVIDARMQQLYWSSFTIDGGQSAEQVTAPEDIILPGAEKIRVVGYGLGAYYERLPLALKARILSSSDEVAPKATTLLELVLQGKIQPVPMHEAVPVYIRNQVTHQGGAHG